ncbi:MAG: hypothetical protein GY774_00235 [Planctomycetes bacterium]|nr:hypothetical protein [Planctomycetota bacterium]
MIERRKVAHFLIGEVREYLKSVEALESLATGEAKEMLMSHNMEICTDIDLMMVCDIEEALNLAEKYTRKVFNEVRECLIATGEIV